MAVSKRTRYEVMKRDNFTCRYCRSTEEKLTVDHVVPVALGGSDQPSNLVAACKDCNAGKSSTSPDAETVEDVAQSAMRWAGAIAEYSRILLADRKKRDAYTRRFVKAWGAWNFGFKNLPIPQPADWKSTIWQFYALGFPIEELEDSVQIACANGRIEASSTFRYMCGVVYRKIDDMQDGAKSILTRNEVSDGS